jgi:hypothetical protein
MTSNCSFPLQEKNILKLTDVWTQELPTGEILETGNGVSGGFAIPVTSSKGCVDKAVCPYACESGFIETQYDNMSNGDFIWENNGKFVGGGKRSVMINGKQTSAGGVQGVVCDKGKLKLEAHSNTDVPEYSNRLCVETPKVLKIINNSSYSVTFCRTTVLNIPQIPTLILAGEEKYLTSIPQCSDYKFATTQVPNTCKNQLHTKAKNSKKVWWKGKQQFCEKPIDNFLTYYISRGDETVLKPISQLNSVRPSTNVPSNKGLDYFPYVLTIDENNVVKVNSNNDLLVGMCSGYDTSLGNPKIGLRVYGSNKMVVGSCEYVGPATTTSRSVLCNQNGCSNVYPVIIEKGQIQPDCRALKKGVQTKAKNSFYPIVVEIYNVAPTTVNELPKNICTSGVCGSTVGVKTMSQQVKDRLARTSIKNSIEIPRQSTTTNNKIFIWIIVILAIVLIIVAIIFFIWLYMRNNNKRKEEILRRELRQEQVERAQLNIGVQGRAFTPGIINPKDVYDVISINDGILPKYVKAEEAIVE